MATVQDAERRELLDDIRAVELGIERGVCPSRVAKAHSVWTTWIAFCDSIQVDPGLSTVDDPLLIILLFGTQWRRGKIAPSKRQVRGRTAEDAMRQVGQAFSSLGMLDPRMNRFAPGTMDFRWTRLLKSWKKADPAAQRVRPLPRALLRHATKLAKKSTSTNAAQAMNRLMWLGFFFLLRPGEYLSKAGTQFPFKLKQVFFRVRGTEFRGDVIPFRLLDTSLVTFSGLIFDKQKNAVPDEKIGLGTSINGDNPTATLIELVRHLRQSQHTTGDTPIFTYYSEFGVACNVTDRMMTKYLRAVALSVEVDRPPTIGALRCTGATALLEGNIPTSLIKLLGRWRSDEVFRYLHTQSEPLMQRLTDVLVDHVEH